MIGWALLTCQFLRPVWRWSDRLVLGIWRWLWFRWDWPYSYYDAPGTYEVKLVVTDRTGCETEKIRVIEITEGYKIILPNAFTPNGDGNNDFYRPRMLGLDKVQLIIYNTWAEVIFNTKDIETKRWDLKVDGWVFQHIISMSLINLWSTKRVYWQGSIPSMPDSNSCSVELED